MKEGLWDGETSPIELPGISFYKWKQEYSQVSKTSISFEYTSPLNYVGIVTQNWASPPGATRSPQGWYRGGEKRREGPYQYLLIVHVRELTPENISTIKLLTVPFSPQPFRPLCFDFKLPLMWLCKQLARGNVHIHVYTCANFPQRMPSVKPCHRTLR